MNRQVEYPRAENPFVKVYSQLAAEKKNGM